MSEDKSNSTGIVSNPAYYSDIFGFHGDFLFADNIEEARLMVVQNNGFMLIDDNLEPIEIQPLKSRSIEKNTTLPVITVPFGKQTIPVIMLRNFPRY